MACLSTCRRAYTVALPLLLPCPGCNVLTLLLLQGIVDGDPQLAQHAEHLKYRFEQYRRMREAIEGAEGSLADFARVHVGLLRPADLACCLQS